MHLSELDTPALVIDLAVLRRNIARAQDHLRAHGVAFRPHMKTHKMPEVGRLQVEAGAVGLTCAKLGEAEVMADAGFSDLMLAYPILGPGKLARLAALAGRIRLTLAFDSIEVAEGVSAAVTDAGARLGVLVETDTGMRRCGAAPGDELEKLCVRVRSLPGLDFRGIMTYQGYVDGTREERVRSLEEEDQRLGDILSRLEQRDISCEVVSGASTPNLFLSHHLTTVNENRCGTYVFNDRNTVASGSVTWDDCAARVAVTVVSTAVPGQVIIDGGSKTFSSDGSAAGPGYGYVVEDPSLCFAKMNEEHGYLRFGPDGPAAGRGIGDRLHVVPNHVCACVNMHDRVWVHEGDQVVDCWEVAARGRIR